MTQSFEEAVKKEYLRVMHKHVALMINRAKALTPVRTGRLQYGFRFRTEDTNFVIHNTVPYWGFVEYGINQRPRLMFTRAKRQMLMRLKGFRQATLWEF